MKSEKGFAEDRLRVVCLGAGSSLASVELNIAEGYSFGNTPTFTRHLGIAHGSAVETLELPRLGVEAEVLQTHEGVGLLLHANRSCQLLLGLLKRRRRFRSS